jgi:hypothetical protein
MSNSVVGLMIRTYPFIFLRLLVNVLIVWPAYEAVLWGIDTGRKLTNVDLLVADLLFGWIGLAAFIIYIEFARKFTIHLIRYAQIACVTELITNNEIKGSSLVFGFRTMLSRFGTVAIMYLANNLMTKAVSQVSGWIVENGKFIPAIFKKGLLANLVSSTIKTVVFNVDEIVVSYLYKNKEMPLWEGTTNGISLYVQSWQSVLKSAFLSVLWLKVFGIVLALSIWSYGIWYLWGGGIKSMLVFFFVYKIVSVLIKSTLVEPYQSISMLVGFYEAKADSKEPMDLSEKLSEVSSEFKQMLLKGRTQSADLSEKLASLVTGEMSNSTEEVSMLGKLDKLIGAGKGSSGVE